MKYNNEYDFKAAGCLRGLIGEKLIPVRELYERLRGLLSRVLGILPQFQRGKRSDGTFDLSLQGLAELRYSAFKDFPCFPLGTLDFRVRLQGNVVPIASPNEKPVIGQLIESPYYLFSESGAVAKIDKDAKLIKDAERSALKTHAAVERERNFWKWFLHLVLLTETRPPFNYTFQYRRCA